MEVARWAKERGCPWDAWTCTGPRQAATWRCCSGCERTAAPWDEWTCAYAARGGHLGGAAVGASERMPVERVDLRQAAVAATWRCCSGRARTALRGTRGLARCRERRPPGGAAVGARERRSVERVDLRRAAEGGHLEVLQWARANGAPWDETGLAPMPRKAATWRCYSGRARTALRGTRDLRRCRGRRPPGGAAVGASERMLRGTRDLRRAARGGHLEVLQWARANGAPWNEGLAQMPRKAATWRCCSGRARTAAPWDERLARCRGRRPPGGAAVGARERLLRGTRDLRDAAEGGHLEVLQWARANGCSVDEWTCTDAAEGGHLEVLQWARANGCSVGRETCTLPRKAATWRCSSGRARTAARGIRRTAKRSAAARGCAAVDSCRGRRGGVVASGRCAARRCVCFSSPRHALPAAARRVRVFE